MGENSLQVSPRRTLSAHISTACQPKKALGPSASSLKTFGLDTFYQSLAGNPAQPLADSLPVADGLHGQP